MKVLVTGAAGFVGNNTVRRLVELGKPVRAMVRDPDRAGARLGDLAGRIEIVRADVTDRDALAPLMEGVDAVVHLVAIALERGDRTYEAVNHQGTVNVVDAAQRAGVGRFVFMSQNGADSASPYAFLRSKGRAQDYVALRASGWTTLRPSAIFGPQDEFFNAIARLVRLTPVVFPLIGGGRAEFQPVSVYDVVEAIVRSLQDDTTIGRALDLGGPEVLTLGEIERRILRALGVRRWLFPAPVWLLRPPVFLMEKVLPGTPVSRSLLDLLAVPNTTPNNALIEHFGIEPRPFSGEHIAYLRANAARSALRRLFTGEKVN
ncbi:MAG: complex I NDUFA9 subunit family protein [Armatimonadota bacterium]|nr:complex I NDUFA9 subunit family protein [Armatimonadota bacterium]MDR5696476.1 complex I NDUFA9 subunit family protein [Armatimonadota bacterium]